MFQWRFTLIFFIHLCQIKNVINIQGGDFCLTESFHADCGKDSVIFVTSAHFGRMRLGRCVTKDYGTLGCQINVLRTVDSMCSGRQECTFSVSDPLLVRKKPCPQDFSSYLEISFECVKVLSLSRRECSPINMAHLPESIIFITGTAAQITSCALKEKPEKLIVPEGQRIKITLFNFAVVNKTFKAMEQRNSYSVFCQQFARIREKNIARSTVVCGDDKREKIAYESVSNEIDISIMRGTLSSMQQYLLRIEAFGCANLKPLPDSISKRLNNRLHITCNQSQETSILTCKSNVWHGIPPNCTQITTKTEKSESSETSLPPIGVSVVIIVGVALVVVVYIGIMIICVMYLQRKRRYRHSFSSNVCMDGQESDMQLSKDNINGNVVEEEVPMLPKQISTEAIYLTKFNALDSRGMRHKHLNSQPFSDSPIYQQKCDCFAMINNSHEPIYAQRGPSLTCEHSARIHKVQCPTVPETNWSLISELDAKSLNMIKNRNADISFLPDPDIVDIGKHQGKATNCSNALQQSLNQCSSNAT